MIPTEEHVTAGPRPEPPCASSRSASHAIPLVHTTPNAMPKTIRPASTAASDGKAWAAQARHSRAPAPRVTRRAPMRSAAMPEGTETASVASPGSASRSAVCEADRPKCADIRGSRGTIAAWATPATRNRPYRSQSETDAGSERT